MTQQADPTPDPQDRTAPQGGSGETIGARRPADTGETIGANGDQTTGSDNTLQRDPSEWVTGDEPMTEAQKSYLDTLAKEAGEELPASLTKAEASQHIDRLQQASKRVQ